MKKALLFLLLISSSAYAATEFEKVGEYEFKGTESKEEVKTYSLTDLKNDRAIYEAEIVTYQAKIDAVDVLIAEGEDLGVIEKPDDVVVAEPIVAAPKPKSNIQPKSKKK